MSAATTLGSRLMTGKAAREREQAAFRRGCEERATRLGAEDGAVYYHGVNLYGGSSWFDSARTRYAALRRERTEPNVYAPEYTTNRFKVDKYCGETCLMAQKRNGAAWQPYPGQVLWNYDMIRPEDFEALKKLFEHPTRVTTDPVPELELDVTEREARKRERAAFIAGCEHHRDYLVTEGVPHAAACKNWDDSIAQALVVFPKLTRTETRPRTVGGYRIVDGDTKYGHGIHGVTSQYNMLTDPKELRDAVTYLDGGSTRTVKLSNGLWCTSPLGPVTKQEMLNLADLLENPTESVEVDDEG